MDDLHTGDLLLFSNNSSTGFLLKTFTSSVWNHAGVAIRMLPSGKISDTNEGTLYILEVNTVERYDIISKQSIKGVTISEFEWVSRSYNLIAYRKLNRRLITPQFITKVTRFIRKYHKRPFPGSSMPFIGVWLGLPMGGDDSSRGSIFCSELAANFYSQCLGVDDIGDERNVSKQLQYLFGSTSPELYQLYSPLSFTADKTPECKIFESEELPVHRVKSSAGNVLAQPIIITLAIMIVIGMSLPK